MIRVSFYDTDLKRQGMITSFISLVWEEGYNTEGAFQLECVLNDDLLELLNLDWYCGITDHDTLMVIESIEIEDDTVVVSGYPAIHLFDNRVSNAEISNENAEQAMRSLFNSMEGFPCVKLGTSANLDDIFEETTSEGTILEYFETIAEACDIGFRMRHDKSERLMYLDIYKGEQNSNAKYSTLYGNMGDISYELSNVDYKNVALVIGENTDEETVTVYAGDTDAEGVDRREIIVSGDSQEEEETDSDYEARLIAQGEEELLEQLQVESISFTTNDDDVSLGDIVYCHIPEIGIDTKVRVTYVSETSQKNVTTKEITLGTPVIIRRY